MHPAPSMPETIRFRVSPTHKRSIIKAAERYGLCLSEFVRDAVIRASMRDGNAAGERRGREGEAA